MEYTYSNLKEKAQHGNSYFEFSNYQVNTAQPDELILYHHWHSQCELLVITQGEAELNVNNQKIMITAPSIAFIPSNQLHSVYRSNNEPCQLDAYLFDETFLNSQTNDITQQETLLPLFQQTTGLKIASNTLPNPLLLERLAQLTCVDSEKNAILIKAVLLELMYYFRQKLKTTSEKPLRYSLSLKRQRTIIQYINDNYQQPLTIKEMSHVLNLSSEHFLRFFKKHLGITPITFLNRYRVNQGIKLLLTTDLPIIDIALDVGFDSANYFAIVFKKHTGCSPSYYRKAHKKRS